MGTLHMRNYLKTFRKRSGLSQRELALLLGCKHGSKVSRYERNERLPSPRTLIGYEIVFRKQTLRTLFKGVCEEITPGIKDRARRLSRDLDAMPYTKLSKQKRDFLTDLIFARDDKQA